MEDFDLDQGVEDMKDFNFGQGALGLNLVKESYEFRHGLRSLRLGHGAWASTWLEEISTWLWRS